jgi:anti-anti-sigma factor
MDAPATRKRKRKSSVLHIEGDMTIYRAAELKQTLMEALNQATASIEVNLSKVTALDAAGVQLLLFAKRAALSKNKVMRLIEKSSSVTEVFQLLNLAPYFEEPSSAPMLIA